MPIYNEERFIELALESLQKQDYPNLRILISDNASTDRTGDICRRAAERDERISYHCMDENIGSAPNFRHVAREAQGKYFMWAAGHDEWSTDLVSRSVEILEENESAAIAVATSFWIDENGERLDRDTDYPDTRLRSLFGRFFTVFWGNMHPVLGVIRLEYLAGSKSMQSFVGADLVLLSELALCGDFVHPRDAWWNRRDVRTKETHNERMKRYTGAEFGQAESTLDKRFPLLRLPFALISCVWMSRVAWYHKALLILALLPLMPLRYIIGRQQANKR
ncbi:MAG: glycosyltransferase family 2 protein [Gammaproteobacteria bacterium]|nr:glycosyltransferase family 2 protein [Gammaproteobacteria bacterium]